MLTAVDTVLKVEVVASDEEDTVVTKAGDVAASSAQWSSGKGDPALVETFRSLSKFTRGLGPDPFFQPQPELKRWPCRGGLVPPASLSMRDSMSLRPNPSPHPAGAIFVDESHHDMDKPELRT